MRLIPLKARRIVPGDDLVSELLEAVNRDPASVKTTAGRQGVGLMDQDIVVISSKAVATSEGRIIDLGALKISGKAEELSKQCGRSTTFCQAVLDEVKLRRGSVRGTCSGAPRGARSAKWGAILTELCPKGLPSGTIFAANAGLDESNVEAGCAIGWPSDPVESVARLRKELTKHAAGVGGKESWARNQSVPSSPSYQPLTPHLAVILSDSCCLPRRQGVIAFALAVSGIDPLQDEAGKKDLFGKPLRITVEAVADQLATAANMLMGNAAQSIPAVIIRDHNLSLSSFEGWVPGIEPEKDLFQSL